MGFACITGSFRHVETSIKEIILNPKSTWATFWQRAEARDKALKLADPVLDAIIEIAKARGASDETIQGLGKGRALAKTGRDALAFFNIFNGVIAGFIENFTKVRILACELTSDLCCKKAEEDEVDEVGIGEKFLDLMANFGKLLGAGSFIVGFGVCRPIANLEKHCGVKFNSTTHEIGHAFPKVMIVNHVGGVIGSSFEIGYQYLKFKRLSKEGGDQTKAYNDFLEDTTGNVVSLAEKSLECTQDIFHLTGKAVPPAVRIPLGLGIGLLGCTKEWLKASKYSQPRYSAAEAA